MLVANKILGYTIKFTLFVCLNTIIITPFLSQNDTLNQTFEGRRNGYWVMNGQMKKDTAYHPLSKVEEGVFNKGRKTGIWTKYYPSGSVKSKINYVNGRSYGDFELYFPNGQIEEKGTWQSKVYNGKFVRYYEDGTIAQEKTFNSKGKTEGKVVYYYPNGQAELVFETLNGKGSGEAVRSWPNGDVKEKITFNEKGESSTTGTMERKNPPVEKSSEIISAKQAIEAEGELNIGFLPSAKGKMLKDGYHKTYNDNKDILMDGAFKSGKLWTGKHYIYDENGLLERIDVYKEGAFSGNGVL